LSLSTDIQVSIPAISDFVFQNEAVDLEISLQFKLRFKGILAIASFRIINPSEITLVGKNLVYRIYRLDDNTKTLIGEQDMVPSEISPKTDLYVNTEVLISYRKFFFSAGLKFLPDWIILRIDGNILIAGTKQVIPISVQGYLDPHLIRTIDKR
jgi:hypothetical protein